MQGGACPPLGLDVGRGRSGAGPDRVLSRLVVAAVAVAADRLQRIRAMPAARVEYIAPWWVVWLHSVPHLGLRLQRVDSTFSPGDETYQEVSKPARRRSQPLLGTLGAGAGAGPSARRSRLHPLLPQQPALSAVRPPRSPVGSSRLSRRPWAGTLDLARNLGVRKAGEIGVRAPRGRRGSARRLRAGGGG